MGKLSMGTLLDLIIKETLMGEAKRRSQLNPNYVQGKPQEVVKLQQAPRQLQEKKRLDIISVENRSAMILEILSFALKHKTPGVVWAEISYPCDFAVQSEETLAEVSLSFSSLLTLVNDERTFICEQWEEHCEKVSDYGEYDYYMKMPFPTPPDFTKPSFYDEIFALMSECDFTTHRVFHFIGETEKNLILGLSEVQVEFEKMISLVSKVS